MSIHTYHGGKFTPQSGGRLIPSTLGQPKIFLPNAQVGYGIGGVLKPLARGLLQKFATSTLKKDLKKAIFKSIDRPKQNKKVTHKSIGRPKRKSIGRPKQKKKVTHKRKRFVLKSTPSKRRRRKDIFDK